MNIFKQVWNAIGIRTRIRRFRKTPHIFKEHFRYALRRAMIPQIVTPLWVTSNKGTRYYISADAADDEIIQDLYTRRKNNKQLAGKKYFCLFRRHVNLHKNYKGYTIAHIKVSA